MVNKRGWLRIVEAVIAILIVFGAVLTVSMQSKTNRATDDICESLYPLLDEAAKNVSLRSEILNNDKSNVEDFFKKRIKNPSIDMEVKICELSDICPHNRAGMDKADVCAAERVISSSSTSSNPKKLKVFLFKTRMP